MQDTNEQPDRIEEYRKWVSSLNDSDLEDEYFARFNDEDSPRNDENFLLADDERNKRLIAGRYLED